MIKDIQKINRTSRSPKLSGFKGYQCVLIFLLFVQVSMAQNQKPQTILVDDQLQYQSVNLESVTQTSIGFFDQNLSYQQLPRDRVLQLRDIHEQAMQAVQPSKQKGLLVLTDGQQFVGRMDLSAIKKTSDDQSAVHWFSPILGALAVPLDDVKSISFSQLLEVDPKQTDDQIELANGDQLKGFVLGLTAKTLELELADQSTGTKIALGQIKSIVLANPRKLLSHAIERLYFVDGSIMYCKISELGRDMFYVSQTQWHANVKIPSREIARVDLASTRYQLLSLTQQNFELLEGAQAFGVDFPPKILHDKIQLHAPTTIRFDLPHGVVRFAVDAQIDWQAADPPRARKFSDFILHVYLDDLEVFKQQFNAKAQSHRINLPITPNNKRLTLKITPGLNGPVMDRLRLTEPVLMIDGTP